MKTEVKSIIIGIMTIIIFIGGCYFIGQQVKLIKSEIQYESYSYGQASIINKINQEGKVPITYTKNNQTIVQWISLQQLCGGSQ